MEIPLMRNLFDIYLLLFRRQYFGGRFATVHSADFLKDPRFLRAYQIALKRGNYGYAWQAKVACWAAAHAYELNGDFVECGVNRGSITAAVIDYINWREDHRMFYLFDTFCGVVEQQITCNDKGAHYNRYEECYAEVLQYFSKWSNVRLVRGVIPESLRSWIFPTSLIYRLT